MQEPRPPLIRRGDSPAATRTETTNDRDPVQTQVSLDHDDARGCKFGHSFAGLARERSARPRQIEFSLAWRPIPRPKPMLLDAVSIPSQGVPLLIPYRGR
jgi:hypothetical protein